MTKLKIYWFVSWLLVIVSCLFLVSCVLAPFLFIAF